MKLRARLTNDGGLHLNAATYSTGEIGVLLDVLSEAGGFRIRNPVGRDRRGRLLYEFQISEIGLKRLQSILGGRFDEEGHFIPKVTRGGRKYACQEVTDAGRIHRCENITATDDSTASVKCGFVAGRNNWFGGLARAGVCSDRR